MYYFDEHEGNYYWRNRKVAIIGCGDEGEKLYKMLQGKVNLFDNYKKGAWGGKFIAPLKSKAQLKKYFLLISTNQYYEEIKIQLQTMGLIEFEDFILGKWINRKICVVYGNCYGDVIREGIRSSAEFCKRYEIYPTKGIHLMKDPMDEHVLEKCDLFITQDISTNNFFGYQYSTEYLMPKLKEDCIKIVIPNLVGMGNAFFIQGEFERVINEEYPFIDKNIDKMLKEGKRKEDIINEICSGKMYSGEFILQNFSEVIEKFREKEKNWDIKIIDYILENYREKQMFYDNFHPTNEVMNRIVNEILSILGIHDEYHIRGNLGIVEMMLYPEVKEVLGLNWKSKSAKNYMNDYIDSFRKMPEYM